MANPRPTPKPENLRPPWPPGTSGNPAGYSRGRRVSDTVERLIDEKALDRDFGATAITIVAEGATHSHSLNTVNVVVEGAAGATHSLNTGNVGGPQRPSRKVHGQSRRGPCRQAAGPRRLVATAARSTRSLTEDPWIQVPVTVVGQMTEVFIPMYTVEVKKVQIQRLLDNLHQIQGVRLTPKRQRGTRQSHCGKEEGPSLTRFEVALFLHLAP